MKLNQIIKLRYSGRDAVSLCQKIRKHAYFGRLNVAKEDSGMDITEYVKTSRFTFKEFAYRYLANIQPFGLFCIRTGWMANYLIDTIHKDGFIIEVIDTGGGDLNVSFSSNHILVNGTKPVFKCSRNQLCAVIVDIAEPLKNHEYKISYTVPYGLMKLEITGKTIFYKNGIALVRYKDIEDSCRCEIQDIYKDIRNYSYFTDQTNSMVRVRMDNQRFKRISLPDGLVKGIRPGELESMSIGGMPENYIHFLIDIYPMFKDRTILCYITGLADEILMEMPNFRIDEMRRALKFRSGHGSNELYRKIMNEELPSLDVDDFYKIDTVFDTEDMQFATEAELGDFARESMNAAKVSAG